jgi:hypothetical protein
MKKQIQDNVSQVVGEIIFETPLQIWEGKNLVRLIGRG